MLTTLPFWIAFVTTVLLLAASLTTGLLHRRRLHLWFGPLTMVSLAIAIVLTEQLMKRYEFPPETLRMHLWFAKSGGLLALPVIVTGIWLVRSERARRWHRIAVMVWILSVLAATGTGLFLFSLGTVKGG